MTKALVPRLRFPEFRKEEEWSEEKLENLVTTVPPSLKLQSSSYLDHGKYPIIDQSQELICGWTDNENAIITERLPLIVFGDHTCALKFADKPFAQGADGIKIIKPKPVITAEFLFHSLNNRPLVMEDYKRHFSTLKKRVVFFPDIESGEQQKIADCLSSLDELIAAETKKLAALKTYKKGLMQQLFPREGETVPRLRFPEFRDAGEWEKKALEAICEMQAGKFINAADISDESAINFYPCFGGNGLRGYTKTYNYSGRYSLIGRQGALCGNINFVEGDFYATEHAVVATANLGISADWLFYNLCFLNLNRFATGQAQPGLSVDVLTKVVCAVPKNENEQQRIAGCLSALDDQITVQAQKIEALKTHKKGLLQQLFPVLDEVGA